MKLSDFYKRLKSCDLADSTDEGLQESDNTVYQTLGSHASQGLDPDEWEKYLSCRHEALKASNPQTAQAQARIVEAFSGPVVAIKRFIRLSPGLAFKRGTRGNEIDPRAIDVMPTRAFDGFRRLLKDHDVALVHLQGCICTIATDDLRYPKK